MRDARNASRAATCRRSGRVKRRLFNLAAAVSLVACAASVVLWVTGHETIPPMNWPDAPVTSVRLVAGSLNRRVYVGLITPLEGNPEVAWEKFGFSYTHRRAGATAPTGTRLT